MMDVVYCEGWAPETRAIVGRISAAEARDRHERGGQYAVALTDGQPRVLLEIAWAHRFAQCWHFDEHGRRVRRIDYRVLADGRLFLHGEDEWDHETLRVKRRYDPDGQHREEIQEEFGLMAKFGPVAVEGLTQPVPAFGDWLPLARLDEPVELRDMADPESTEPAAPPWRPPAPMAPFALTETFTPGTRFALPDDDDTVIIETRLAGTLRLTSGRLVAADPGWPKNNLRPFTATVPPGEYPVELSVVRFDNDHARVAAAKVTIAPDPVVSWELALLPGQDPFLLDDQACYCFGVDSGTASVFDADALAADDDLSAKPGNDLVEVVELASGANLIAFQSGYGDGAYPTWQGRAEDSTVVAFVADLLVLHGGEILP